MVRGFFRVCALLCAVTLGVCAQAEFVNFESPHIHPLDLSPNGNTLAACNTADNRLEIFSLASGAPVLTKSVVVGLDPVSVRFVSNTRALVVNHISDSVSVVNVNLGAVERTIQTLDEPCDAVAAGPAGRAFITCSQQSKIQVVDYTTGAISNTISVLGESPRALAVSPDKSKVYAAIFESGNKSTILAGGALDLSVIPYPPNVVSNSSGPYAGQNPPPNDGNQFFPPKNPGNGVPPRVGQIVKQNGSGQWLDDAGENWSNLVDGANAAASGRPVGWTLLDHDIAVIDANALTITYVDGLMNINMAMAVNPASGLVSVVGTDAVNELRFEPNVNGIFVRVMMATANDTARTGLVDLNAAHLSAAMQAEHGNSNPYFRPRISPPQRAKSVGDPRGIAWNAAGTRAYITGLGSNNMIAVDTSGNRPSVGATTTLREGPTGVVVDSLRGQVYALNRFDASISTVSEATLQETANLPFHDTTPQAIRAGRKHLYDTHKTSGLGQVSCGSCHVDARTDWLGWDLGDPAGEPKLARDLGVGGDLNLGANFPLLTDNFDDFHPMKGPMTTQTLVGIIGHEPFHWRGDRLGLEEFNPAFPGLLGDDGPLTPTEMQEFEDFLATIYFPPNPYRNLDNSLPTNLPLEGHYATGDNNLAEGTPLPNGNAVNGLRLFRGVPDLAGTPTRFLDQDTFTCMTCHTLPSGDGTNARFNGGLWTPIPPNPVTGNRHVAMVSIDGSTNLGIKVPHLQPVYHKVGYLQVNRAGNKTSTAGFGYLHDGSIDSIERFFAAGGPHDGAFRFANDQEVADMVALMLAFSGGDFPEENVNPVFNPPGNETLDAHAAVGEQVTFNNLAANDFVRLNQLIAVVENEAELAMTASGKWRGNPRGFIYAGNDNFTPDENGAASISLDDLLAWEPGDALAEAITFTIVPAGTQVAAAQDRDGDGYYDYTELLDGSDPADPDSFGPQGEGAIDGALEGEGASEGEGVAEGEGVVEGEGALEGEGVSEGEGAEEGVLEGEGAGEGAGEGEGAVEGEGEGTVEPPAKHSADVNNSRSIDLSELLRSVQFYNANGFRCTFPNEPATDDGFMPGFGVCNNCTLNTADYDASKCRLSLSELLRLVQLFNVGSYYACDSPDYFCPGASDPAPGK